MNNLQEKIKSFCKEHNMESSTEYRLIDLISEIGETAKEILKMTNYGKNSINLSNKDQIESELGDTLFSLIAFANTLNIDLDKALNTVLKKYQKRLAKGSAGSEND
jgi:NTP pyrophosphatase (non-canonical NTP hydrolase)